MLVSCCSLCSKSNNSTFRYQRYWYFAKKYRNIQKVLEPQIQVRLPPMQWLTRIWWTARRPLLMGFILIIFTYSVFRSLNEGLNELYCYESSELRFWYVIRLCLEGSPEMKVLFIKLVHLFKNQPHENIDPGNHRKIRIIFLPTTDSQNGIIHDS